MTEAECAIKDGLRALAPVETNDIVVSYLTKMCLEFLPSKSSHVKEELIEVVWPLADSMRIPREALEQFIAEKLLPYYEQQTSIQEKASIRNENPLLVPLENPIVMSEMNWVYLLRDKYGLASFHTAESVTGDATIYSASQRYQQKLNLELLASSKQSTSSSLSFVDHEKLRKAELKQKAKQERREKAEFPNKPQPKQIAASGALPVDESTLLDPLVRTRKIRDIKLDHFDISISGKHIVTDGQLNIPYGRRVGLIGRNGVGKSTLLRALSSRQLSVPKHISILHVEQEVIGDDTPALESVLKADSVREALLAREKTCQTRLNDAASSAGEKDVALAELQKIYAKLEEIESDKAESRYGASFVLVDRFYLLY